MNKPKPKYGWSGQTNTATKYPVGTEVYITGGQGMGIHPYAMLAEVIDFGTPPTLLKHLMDLVHLEIVDPRGSNLIYSQGYRDYWQEHQLEPVPTATVP